MCGIAGVLSFNRSSKVAKEQLQKMTDALIHRGPDGDGHYLSEKRHVGLGHRRLSIIDLSAKGVQPMCLHDSERFHVTFNGEIYNYVELRKGLEQDGYIFNTSTDTEVLLRLYSIKREKCLELLDGMFAFAIWDSLEEVLFCARDRFGEKPFYYFKDQEKFLFASEMKAIFAYGKEVSINQQRVFDYLHHGFVVDRYGEDSTYYEGIKELPPASYLYINTRGEQKINKYWTIGELNRDSKMPFDTAVEKFQELFDRSVQIRLRSDVTVGSSLSGGLDSSAIVASIDRLKLGEQKQQTFSARFKNHSKDEGEFIEAVSSHIGISGHMIWPDAETFVSNLEKHFYYQEEPYQHTSVFAQHEVMKLAKEHGVTVLLDGQGADEILGGYHGYFEIFLKELVLENKSAYILQKKALEFNYGRPFGFSKSKQMSYRFPALFNPLSKAINALRPTIGDTNDRLSQDFYDSHYRSHPLFIPNRLKESLSAAVTHSSLPKLLRYGDRNSMAHSREVRLPFLSHHLVEFLFSLPSTMLINKGWTKYILRESMKDRLPEMITWRKDKIGYEPPQKQWLESKVIQELKSESISLLKGKGVITEASDSETWKYLMIAQLYSTFR